MSLFSKNIKNLNDLFVHQLQDILYAEKEIVKDLPTMIDKAENSASRRVFRTICVRPRATSSASNRSLQ